MMEIIFKGQGALFDVIAVILLIKSIRQEIWIDKMSEEEWSKLIINNSYFKWISVVGLLIAANTVWFPSNFSTEPLGAQIIYTVFVCGLEILGLCVGLMGLNWRIEIKDDHFIYTNTFGIKKTYKFNEVRYKTMTAVSRYYKIGKRLPIFNISNFTYNTFALDITIDKYRREHHMYR